MRCLTLIALLIQILLTARSATNGEMSLPIAVGGKALSSKRITCPIPNDEYTRDGTTFQASILNTGPSVIVCTTLQLQATISVSYYDLNRPNSGSHLCDGNIAEIRVQISHLSTAYSSSIRELLYRIWLPQCEEGNDNTTKNNQVMIPCAMFAMDGRHLACTVPYPRSDPRTIVVIFQLRRPRAAPQSGFLPKPSYIDDEERRIEPPPPIPIATNPIVVTVLNDIGEECPLYTVTSMCDLSTQLSGKRLSVLVAGCIDGSLQIISYRRAKVTRVLYRPNLEKSPIICLSHETFSQPMEAESRGKLVSINHDGKAIVFETQYSHEKEMHESFVEMVTAQDSMHDGGRGSHFDNQDSHQNTSLDSAESTVLSSKRIPLTKMDDPIIFVKLHKLAEIKGAYIAGAWVDNKLLAVIPTPTRNMEFAAQVWALDEQGRATLLSKLVMTPALLEECAHSSFAFPFLSDGEHTGLKPVSELVSIDFDIQTGCLAVSSFLAVNSDSVQPFSCVWNWRTNTLGLTIKSRSRIAVSQNVSGDLLASQSAMSQLKFCSDSAGGERLLVHLFSLVGPSWEVDHRIRKGVYDLATISPPDTINQPRNEFRLPSPLILGSKSVSFPVYYNVSPTPLRERPFS